MNQHIDSGDTIEDVIEFVRIEMYKDLNEIEDECSDGGGNVNEINEDDEDGIEGVEDSYSELVGSPSKNKKSGNRSESGVMTVAPNLNPKRSIDDDIPIDWTFPGFVSLILYGPFAEKHDKLAVFEINDSCLGVDSISKKRNKELITK